MTIDDVRAAAEKAKAFDPNDPYLCTRARCSKSAMLVLKADKLCDKCLGAKRVVEDIAEHVDDAVRNLRNNAVQPDRSWREAATASADRAARIASYFASEPNPVSEFRDAVRKFVEAGK